MCYHTQITTHCRQRKTLLLTRLLPTVAGGAERKTPSAERTMGVLESRMKKKPIIERHHRLPRSRGGTDHHSNIIHVRQSEHRAWHLLFGNMLADEVAAMITDTWIDGDYYLVAIPRKRKKAKAPRTRVYCTTCNCEVLKCLKTTEAWVSHFEIPIYSGGDFFSKNIGYYWD